MQKKSAKSRQSQPKEAKLYTPQPVRDRVVALHVTGQSNRQIAAQEHIDRGTVGKILSQREAVEMIARQRCRLQGMADKALDVVEQALDGDDPRLTVPVAMKIIEHVLPKSGEQPLGISPEAQQKDRRRAIIAQIVDDSIYKSQVYGHPLHPDLEKIKQEADRRMEEERGSSTN